MPSLWFLVPVHGRLPLARICLRQLRRTCDALADEGIEATAVVIADKQNLEQIDLHGFGSIERDNDFLSRRFNDGFQLACDPSVNPRPADYAVPIGSDDWVDHRIFTQLPGPDTVLGFQHCSFVSPDGREMTSTHLKVIGGCGIRVYPKQILAATGYRPADEDRVRGCDTSALNNTAEALNHELNVAHRVIDPRQIVDWKSDDVQVTPYDSIYARHRGSKLEPFSELSGFYPDDALEAMAAHYGVRDLVAA